MSAAPEERFEVGDLDPAGVLALARTNEREIRERELLRLELAYQWAVLHPATADTGVETPGGPGLGVLEADETLGGAGTPQVAAFAPEALAVAMGISPAAARSLMADVMDMKHRHPKLWKRVGRLQIPAWQARRVVQQTRQLSGEAAEYVDDRLATHTAAGPRTVDRVVAEAIARLDPAEHQRREDRGKASWDVTLTHPAPTEFAGTSELWARGDSIALQALYDQICAQAHQRHLDGDTDHLGARKARALTELGTGEATRGDKIKVYVRVQATDLDTDAVGDVEKLGPATLTKIKQWVGHHRITIQPVLDPGRDDPVDTHDPPPWMRELVMLRDGHCVFPGCQVDARSCDLDHIEPYIDPGDGGPPGQTGPGNLACLCRRHHRAKTLGLWRYTRTPIGSYTWHGPHGTAATQIV
jgi:hypothetical protein